MTDIDLYAYGFPIILSMIIAETIYSKIHNLSLYKLNDSMAGFGLLAGNIFVNIATKGGILFF